jgi:hypothetical protein
MAIQDDIMAMLSQVSDAGDRATSRGRQGSEMYGRMADLLSGDNRSKAMREIAMLSDNPEMSIEEQMSFDPLTGSRVADIIEKYMDDAGDGVPATAGLLVGEPDVEVDPMMELVAGMGTPAPRTPVGIEELPAAAPRTPVSMEELPPMPRPALDASAMDSLEREIRVQDEGLAGLMAGQMAPIRSSDIEPMAEYRPGMARFMTVTDEMNRSPSTRRPEGMTEEQNAAFTRMMKAQMGNELFPRTGESPEETFRMFMENDVDAIGKVMDRQGGPSGREITDRGRMLEGGRNEELALELGASLGIGGAVRGLIASRKLPEAMRLIRRTMARRNAARQPYTAEGQGLPVSQGGKPPARINRNPLQEKLYQQMQNPAGPTGGLARGGAVRDKILKTYGGM